MGKTVGLRTNLIRTRGNIFVHDDIMRRLLRIIEASSEEIRKYLASIKGKQALLSKASNVIEQIEDDFETIEPELVGLVLDSL